MGLKKGNSKSYKMSNILEAAFRQYTLLRDCTFKFIHIASSVSISEAITHENNCLPYAFCSTLFAFGIGGSWTPAAFKMVLFVTNVNGLKLLLLLQKVPSYRCQEWLIRL